LKFTFWNYPGPFITHKCWLYRLENLALKLILDNELKKSLCLT